MAIRAPIRRQTIQPQENKLEEKTGKPAVKERPMLFSAAMVRALLDGSKTQTRRVAKFKPRTPGCNLSFSAMRVGHYMTGNPRAGFVLHSGAGDSTFPLICPYGRPGERIYVRETFCLDDDGHEEWPIFRADGTALPQRPTTRKPARWTPSIHMPRWASRLQLEIVAVRVERLNACSDVDAVAEGIGLNPSAIGMKLTNPPGKSMALAMYSELWDSINGAGSWAANPWVWVIEFKRVTP